jgi:orotidine-5'-phosphate decarboxylase
MIGLLSPAVGYFKVGIAPFTAFGEDILKAVAASGKKVFLDLKFHDIPNTVKNASYVAAKRNIDMLNFHCSGGEAMLQAARDGALTAAKEGARKPLLIGVTVLTSMDKEDLRKAGWAGSVEDKVKEYAIIAARSGMDGVVASPLEIGMIKEACGRDFIVVTPGIRPEWADGDDQKRITTPTEAIRAGADYIVVGRPIIAAKDPLSAARRIVEEMEGA